MFLRPSLAGAVVALLATPAAASAYASPTVALDKKCYVSASQTATEPVTVNAAGFTTFAPIDISIDNAAVPPKDPANPPMTDANGELEGTVNAPFVASGQRFFTLRLAEHNNPAVTVETSAKVTALSVTSSPTRPRTTSTRVRFRGRGFTNRLTPIYAHYVFNGRERHTVRIGKPFGDCGQFSVRRPQFPFKNPHLGTWVVQFDQQQAYDASALVFTRLNIVVKKRVRPRS